MFKQIALVTLADPSREYRAHVHRLHGAFKGAVRVVISDTVVSAFGGDIVWHLHFIDEASWRESGAFERLDELALDTAITRIDGVAYEPDVVRCAAPEIGPEMGNAVYRALLVCVEPFAAPAQEQQWFAEIRRMADYIPEILNAATGKVIRARGDRQWSYIWEQEYRDIADLRGPYMENAYHWGFIDRWFDPEVPERIIDTRLCHSASALERSVIADYRHLVTQPSAIPA